MKIVIVFPSKFFSKDQQNKLGRYDLKFIEGKDIDLEDYEYLYSGDDDLILTADPTYLKDMWEALPIDRIKRMKKLKALCLPTTSFSWVDIKKCREMDIVVTNSPGNSTNAVAEFNIFAMLFLLRKMPLIIKNDYRMDYNRFLNEEVKGLNAGIVGLGKIGTRVAQLCKSLGMKVLYWNRSEKKNEFESLLLEKLFEKSNVIFNTLATPPELKGFLNQDLLLKLGKSTIIISTSDTHVFDTKFILEQVEKENLGGYAFESNDDKYDKYKGNVMVFPEQAYYTRVL